jgi:hypothetical protein
MVANPDRFLTTGVRVAVAFVPYSGGGLREGYGFGGGRIGMGLGAVELGLGLGELPAGLAESVGYGLAGVAILGRGWFDRRGVAQGYFCYQLGWGAGYVCVLDLGEALVERLALLRLTQISQNTRGS